MLLLLLLSCDMCRTSWLSYQRLLDMPVLVALNAADTAMSIAELTDEEAVAEAMEVREGDPPPAK